MRMLQLGDDVDLAREPIGPHRGGELRAEDLESDLAAVLEVMGEIDRGHPAHADLALDAVTRTEGGGNAFQLIGHRVAIPRA